MAADLLDALEREAEHGPALIDPEALAPLLHTLLKEVAVRPRNPDFQALAKAYGAHAAKPDSLAGITEAIKAALKAKGPTLIEVHEQSGFLA